MYYIKIEGGIDRILLHLAKTSNLPHSRDAAVMLCRFSKKAAGHKMVHLTERILTLHSPGALIRLMHAAEQDVY